MPNIVLFILKNIFLRILNLNANISAITKDNICNVIFITLFEYSLFINTVVKLATVIPHKIFNVKKIILLSIIFFTSIVAFAISFIFFFFFF